MRTFNHQSLVGIFNTTTVCSKDPIQKTQKYTMTRTMPFFKPQIVPKGKVLWRQGDELIFELVNLAGRVRHNTVAREGGGNQFCLF